MNKSDYRLTLDVIAREYHRAKGRDAKASLWRLVNQFGDTYAAAFPNFDREKWDAEWDVLRQPSIAPERPDRASCGHSYYAKDHCAEMTCPNYINKNR